MPKSPESEVLTVNLWHTNFNLEV